MKSLNDAYIPGKRLILSLLTLCNIACFIGILMPEVPRFMMWWVVGIIDACALYVIIYLLETKQGAEHLASLAGIGLIAIIDTAIACIIF